jgi:uncharacterized protein YkwD
MFITDSKPVRTRRLRPAVLLAAGALLAGATHTDPAHAAVCSGADKTLAAQGVVAFEAQVVCLTNNERTARGIPALAVHSALTYAARSHSQDMVRRRYFSHTTPEGRTAPQRISAAGYPWRAWGENIRWIGGSPTPRAVMTGWMNSAGHKANILNANFREVGVGAAVGTPFGYAGGTFTQDFGKR